jgi:hypothetical protein
VRSPLDGGKRRRSLGTLRLPWSLRTASRRGNVQWMRAALLLLALATACGHERAALVAARVSTGQGTAEKPIEGASGTLDCPGQTLPQDLGTSDEDGDLRAQHIGAVPVACAVTISMAGYQPYKADLQTVCTAPAQGGCLTVDLRVMLAPEPGKTSGGTK